MAASCWCHLCINTISFLSVIIQSDPGLCVSALRICNRLFLSVGLTKPLSIANILWDLQSHRPVYLLTWVNWCIAWCVPLDRIQLAEEISFQIKWDSKQSENTSSCKFYTSVHQGKSYNSGYHYIAIIAMPKFAVYCPTSQTSWKVSTSFFRSCE